MKMTSKGQVTIPRSVREKVGLQPGCEVEFDAASDGRVFLRRSAGSSRGRALVAQLRGKGTVRMTTDEILALTRGKR